MICLLFNLQVLPLSEEAEAGEGKSDLFSMEDVTVEVMRARGAGGQARFLTSAISF